MADAGHPSPLLFADTLRAVGAPHGFSTRHGGVSTGVFATLNFGNPGDLPPGVARDPRANIEENFRRALAAAGCPGRRVIQVHQVHGAAVHVHRGGGGGEPIVWGDVKADAVVTDDPGCVVAVRTADCAPVLMASADGRVVAAVHAGWRGAVAGVVLEALAAVRALAGPGTPIAAAIGPCISVGAFEVGREVAYAFDRAGPALTRPHPDPSKAWADLPGLLGAQLRSAGVAAEGLDLCTVERPDLFFSHRRDRGLTGRLVAFIGPR